LTLSGPLAWESIEAKRIAIPQHVVHRSFASETVLLNIQTGYYHGLDTIGDRFFDTLQRMSIGAAVTALSREFEQPAERVRNDMLTFCSELSERGLIEFPAAV
jgi:hypothetical protein